MVSIVSFYHARGKKQPLGCFDSRLIYICFLAVRIPGHNGLIKDAKKIIETTKSNSKTKKENGDEDKKIGRGNLMTRTTRAVSEARERPEAADQLKDEDRMRSGVNIL